MNEKAFWRHVDTSQDCWNWTGSTNAHGYGRTLTRTHGSSYAHRVAWMLANNTTVIPEGMAICHTCDNPRCVRASHLFIDTHAGNMADKAAKGRAPGIPRERNGFSKLTIEQAEDVRRRYAGGERQRDIAADYGITQAAVSWIVHH